MRLLKSIPVFICFFVLNTLNAFAYNYPNSFWSVNSAYQSALAAADYSGIIARGSEIISIMANAPDGKEKRDIAVGVYNEMGKAYAATGDYNNSAYTFNLLYNYASKYGNAYYDYVRAAKEYALQYTPVINIYTDNGSTTYFGAKNEPKNGVLYGVCFNGGTRSKLKNESMILTYQELGQKWFSYNTSVLNNAGSSGKAVELALNCPNEGKDIQNINNLTSYLKEISQILDDYSDVPVYLRFAAEFDVWETQARADEFISAFRYVSKYFRDRNSNVGVVWSPNQVSSWNVDIDDYYPGDEYVDWVGISLYAQPYFLGNKYSSDENQVAFHTGKNSDPVTAVKYIIEKYGSRKPVMISESGCGHTVTASGEDTTQFALRRLREYYSYLPMVYPQIKLIAYFDWFVDGESCDYRLSDNKLMQDEYLKLISGDRFIQNDYSDNSDFVYRQVSNGISLNSVFPVFCYAHNYGADISSVAYFIDDNYVGMSCDVPFGTYINANQYIGEHTLKAIARFSDGKTLETKSEVNIYGENANVSVEISDEKIEFDQEPLLYNSRTMVPMRKIFEKLGARVSWDDATNTAVGIKGERSVKLAIGNKTMYVNNKEIRLDTAPIVLSDRTLVPIRAVAEGLGCNVDWNERTNTVEIQPKVFEWSDWTEKLPGDIDDDMYYIEERTEYRYETREETYFTSEYRYPAYKLLKTEDEYGDWSLWQDDPIAESDGTEVETRTVSSAKKYHYAHYCTGNISDSSDRYSSWDRSWRDECEYHDIGWYDYKLDEAPDGNGGYVLYNDDGSLKRCSNSCFRYYIIDTEGGNHTQYRSRAKKKIYYYQSWGEWSEWSEWSQRNPSYLEDEFDDMYIEHRKVYRHKEK